MVAAEQGRNRAADRRPEDFRQPGMGMFTHDSGHTVGGFSKFKRAFDDAIMVELHKVDHTARLPG